jgi:DinB superfamily
MNKALENFQKHTTEFLDALALIPDRARNTAPAGEWSAAYIVHHIADGEIHFAGRYLLALGSDNPTMFFFDEERYPEMLGYEKRSINKSLAAIVGIRATILETLSFIEDQHWARTMVREDGVTVTLEDLVIQADGHISGHIEQLKALAAQI